MFDVSMNGGWGDATAGGATGGDKSSAGKSKRQSEPVVPVTVSHVLAGDDDGDDHIMIGARHFTNVELVGRVAADPVVSGVSVDAAIEDDSSGGQTITVRIFQDGTASAPAFQHGDTVRVYGRLRKFEGVRAVIAFHIAPIAQDKLLAELKLHDAAVLLCQALYKKNVLQTIEQGQFQSAKPCMLSGIQRNNALNNMTNTMNATSTSSRAPAAIGDTGANGLTGVRGRVYAELRKQGAMADDGASSVAIARTLTDLSAKRVLDELEMLCEEGQAYTTTTDAAGNQLYKSVDD